MKKPRIRPIIQAITDNDLYKFTMMMVALMFFSFVKVRYTFVNRSKIPLPKGFAEKVRQQISLMSKLVLTEQEEKFLRGISFLSNSFVDFLRRYQFDPNEVKVEQDAEGYLTIKIEGFWYRTILWEVPLLAIVQELYCDMVSPVDWDIFQTRLESKVANLVAHLVKWAEFGTRRRRSFEVQRREVEYCAKHAQPYFVGTSNVYLAMLYGVKPIGTNAHEFYMVMMGLFGVRSANRMALEYWNNAFDGKLGHALTDTFTTGAFLNDFTTRFAKMFDGLRQDSGDPYVVGHMYLDHYKLLNIDPKKHEIIFSDDLNDVKAIALQEHFSPLIPVSFGIGTFFSNDVGIDSLKIVIKVCEVMDCSRVRPRWVRVVKLGDGDRAKVLGSSEDVAHVEHELGLAEAA